MPASGFSAVPLPMNSRMKSEIGLDSAALTAGLTELAWGAMGSTGSPVVAAAAGWTSLVSPPSSRRLTAAAAHTTGTSAGTSPEFPVCNHAAKPRPIGTTDPAAARATVITGTCGPAAATTPVGAEAVGAGSGAASADAPPSPPTPSTETAARSATPEERSCAAGSPPRGAPTATPDSDGSCIDGAGTDRAGPTSETAERPRWVTEFSAVAVRPPRARGAGSKLSPSLSEPPVVASEPAAGSGRDTRSPRGERPVLVAAPAVRPAPADAASDAVEDEPGEPAVSAKASPGALRAEPTPSATASAPTRPM